MAVKRARIDNDQEHDENTAIAPSDYQFNFIPTLKPNQRLFDLDTVTNTTQPPTELSISTLTQRFKSRMEKSLLKNAKKKDQVALISSQQQPISYEPHFIKHQEFAYTVIVYIQTAFNIIISSTIIYLFIKIILVIRQDFNLKAREHLDGLHKEKLACTNNYIINQCGRSDRIPAVEDLCEEWAACMNKEMVVPQARVSAEAIAEIINSFVEPISYKTLLFISLLSIGTLLTSNVAINIFKRNRKSSRPAQ